MLITFQTIIPDYGQNFISISQIHLEKSQKFQTCISQNEKMPWKGHEKKLSILVIFKWPKNVVEVETLEKEFLGKK